MLTNVEAGLKSQEGAVSLYDPQIRSTIMGVPIVRMIVFVGLYWGPPILGNYHLCIVVPKLKTHEGTISSGEISK